MDFAKDFVMVKSGHLVDGRVFSGLLKSAVGHHVVDQVSFRDGKFRSRYLMLHGYPEIPYEIFAEKDASEAERYVFDLEMKNLKSDEHLKIHGLIEGDDIQLRIEIYKANQMISLLEYAGASYQLRPDTMPLGA
jgi:hypothetical protein